MILAKRGTTCSPIFREALNVVSQTLLLPTTRMLCRLPQRVLHDYVRFIGAEPPNGYGSGDLMKPLFGTCLISACPFGVLAYLDKTWRSSNAAGVIIGAGMAVYIGLSFQYDRRCQYFVAVLLALVPFILCA
jgi:hypothetical protein